MEKMERLLKAVGMSVVLALALALAPRSTALAQQNQMLQISGTVTSVGHVPLGGVSVRVQGTELRALTDANGRYAISAPANGQLAFSRIGQKAVTESVGGRTKIDINMEAVAFLEEVVVTAYTSRAARRYHRRGRERGRRRHRAPHVGQRAAAAQRDGPRRDGRGERIARLARHRAHPRHFLIPEQRPALHRGRDAAPGFLYQLPERGRHRLDPDPQGRLGRVDLRVARQQRRGDHRDEQEGSDGRAARDA